MPQQLGLCPACFQPQTFFTTQTVVFGAAGFLPVAGDWDGDGKDDVGLFDPVGANFFLTEDEAKPNFIFPFGQPGDRPLAGDWLGVARDGTGVFQPFLLRMVLAHSFSRCPISCSPPARRKVFRSQGTGRPWRGTEPFTSPSRDREPR